MRAQPHYWITEVLNVGSSGKSVEQLQKSVASWLGQSVEVDGVFGSKTKDAVAAFQKAVGLHADGIVGQDTGQALRLWKKKEFGFDASHWQKIDWNAFDPSFEYYGTPLTFAIFKSSEGVSVKDSTFQANVEYGNAYGLDCSAYHFLRMEESPFLEAANCYEAVEGSKISTLYLDLEKVPNEVDVSGWLSIFVGILRGLLAPKVSIGIYTSSRVLREYGISLPQSFASMPLWASDRTDQPAVMPWTSWSVWQFGVGHSFPWARNQDLDMNWRVRDVELD